MLQGQSFQIYDAALGTPVLPAQREWVLGHSLVRGGASVVRALDRPGPGRRLEGEEAGMANAGLCF